MPGRTQINKILVVEDNPGDYLLIEELLMEEFDNPGIIHVTSFREAIAYWISAKLRPDVILLDLTLPDKSGEELVSEVLNFAGPVPTIILSGFTDIDFSKKSISLGVSDYLLKDELNAATLLKSILYAKERSKNLSVIQESEKRYSDLFNLSPQPMWLYDLETLKFLQVNFATINHYGYSEEEFKKMSIADIRPASEKTILDAALRVREVRKESMFAGQFKHKKKTGELIIVEIYSTPIQVNGRACISIIALDVTERIEFDHNVTKAIIKTQEEERFEIGAELHDNVCQILTSGLISLGFAKNNIPAEATKHIVATKKYITMATHEIRNLSHRLAPALFDDYTFEEAINALIQNLNLHTLYIVDFVYHENLKKIPLSTELKLNLYRIMQEQLRNTVKYSHAATLSILLKYQNKKLVMQIADDGVGFDVNEVRCGIGLSNVKRRAELFHGTFALRSKPGKGCSIKIEIPVGMNMN